MHFKNRKEAGILLAQALGDYVGTNPLVVGLVRGGVVVAAPIAKALSGELDVMVVRKLSPPLQPEYGIGALAEGGRVLMREGIAQSLAADTYLREEVARQRKELEHKAKMYRARAPRIPVGGRTVIVVDDGVATGGTLKVALLSLADEKPHKLVAAVPVAPKSTKRDLQELPFVDQVIALQLPQDFIAVGQFYDDFSTVTDEQVMELLTQFRGLA